jgi:hypothetical protein
MGIFDSPNAPDVDIPPPEPAERDIPEASRTTQRATEKALARRGRVATLLTGGQGPADQPTLQRKTLLGE